LASLALVLTSASPHLLPRETRGGREEKRKGGEKKERRGLHNPRPVVDQSEMVLI
jgi:hypothetical protein